MDPVNLEFAAQVMPYWFYRRIELINPREYVTFEIDYGYGYWLRRVHLRWSGEYTDIRQVRQLTPGLEFEFFLKSQFKARQIEPIPGGLFSSPCGYGTSPAAPAPVDNTGFSVNFTSAKNTSYKILNWYYPFRDVIEMHVTGQDPAIGQPQYLDVVMEGYYVPDSGLSMWGKV